jgi:hypothetical protein
VGANPMRWFKESRQSQEHGRNLACPGDGAGNGVAGTQ